MSDGSYQLMKKEIPMALILTIVTCGIYGIFWKAHMFKTMNMLLGYQKYSTIKWFILSIITCSIYTVYIEYIMGQDILDLQVKKKMPVPNTNLPILSLVLTGFGLLIVSEVIQQSELNKVLDA